MSTPTIDIAHPRTYAGGVPYDYFAQLRANNPVHWTPEPDLVRRVGDTETVIRGSGFWAVLSHAAVVEASRTPEVFSSSRRGAFLSDPRTKADLIRTRQLLVNMDAPEHRRIRRTVTGAFTPRSIGRLRDSIATHAANLVAGITTAGEFDVVADLAAELPLLVLADLLGIPPGDRNLLYRWSNQLVGFDDPAFGGGDVVAYRATLTEAFEYAAAIYHDRRAQPRDDLCSLLANVTAEGDALTVAEFAQFWLLLVVAGNETTRQLVSGTVLALAQRPDDVRRLRDGSLPIGPAVDELLRWITPIMQFRRTAIADTTLAGTPIAKGDKVVLFYAAANRDPAVFDRPDELVLDRADNPHVSFGTGPHFCLGSHLARLELTTVLQALLPHLDTLRLTGAPVRLESNFVNGVRTAPARFERPEGS